MKLIIKNCLIIKKVYDENNELLFKLKSKNSFNSQKLILNYENKLLFNTAIIDDVSKTTKKSWNTAKSRKYIIYKANDINQIAATATFNFANYVDRPLLYKILFRAPQINKLTIQSIWGHFIINLLPNGDCSILDENEKKIAIISSYRPLKGWVIDYNSFIDTNFLCGLFLLSQYMIHEDDFPDM